MYSGAKKGVFFSENPLTRRIPSECLASFPAKNSEKLLTDKFLRMQSRSKLRVFYRRNSFKYSTFMWSMETGGKSFGRVFSLVFFRLNRFP